MNKRVYIACGNPDDESAQSAIEIIRQQLNALNFDVIVQSETTRSAALQVPLLYDTDYIFCLDGWFESKSGRMIVEIAHRLNIPLMFQTPDSLFDDYIKIVDLLNALSVCYKVSLDEIRAPGRKIDKIEPKIYFCWYCKTQLNIDELNISKFINRDRTTVYHLIKCKYRDEFNNDVKDNYNCLDKLLKRYSQR